MFTRQPEPPPPPRTPTWDDYVNLYESRDPSAGGRFLPEPPPVGEPLTPAHIAAYHDAVGRALRRRYGRGWE